MPAFLRSRHVQRCNAQIAKRPARRQSAGFTTAARTGSSSESCASLRHRTHGGVRHQDTSSDVELAGPPRRQCHVEASHCAAAPGELEKMPDLPDDDALLRSKRFRNGEYFFSLHEGGKNNPLLTQDRDKRLANNNNALAMAARASNDVELGDGQEPLLSEQTLEGREDEISSCRANYRHWVVNEKIPMLQKGLKEAGKISHDNVWLDLTDVEKESLDESWWMKEYAKVQICNSDTTAEILLKAEALIEEDWLDKVDALPGNLYCVGAFGNLMPKDMYQTTSLSKLLGCFTIVMMQIVAPPLIFLSKMPGNIGVLDQREYQWRCWPLSFNPLYDPHDHHVCPGGLRPHEVHLTEDFRRTWTTKLLGIFMMVSFILNGTFVLLEEQKTWKDVYNTFRFLDWKNQRFVMSGRLYLFLGAAINAWVVIWSCLDIYLVLGASTSPQDLVMDALGLLFLYNLDDVGGDLGFVDEDDWPSLRIAWIYNELVHHWPDEEFDEDKLDWWGFLCLTVYKANNAMLAVMIFALPILALLTPFSQIAPDD